MIKSMEKENVILLVEKFIKEIIKMIKEIVK
jgi:hypothetical protein